MWNSQEDLEKEMLLGGKERAQRMMSRNEEGGRAAHNPYAKTVFNRFVMPLAEMIRTDMEEGGAGKRKAHVRLLSPIEPEASAYIAIRTLLTVLLENSGEVGNFRPLCHSIGKNIQSEEILKQYQDMDQAGYFSLERELKRRHSQSLRHRMTLAKMEMKGKGIQPIDWGHGARDQVGAYLIDQLMALDFLEVHRQSMGKKQSWTISLSESTMDLLGEIRGFIEETMPYYLPCIEQPKDWTDVHDGGFHTPGMRRMASSAIIHGNSGGGDPSQLLEAINALQRVKWCVNERVLDVAKEMSRFMETEELVSNAELDKPERPAFLEEVDGKEEMTAQQRLEFKKWKRDTAEWHTQRKLRVQRYGRMFNVFRVGERFRNERELYFVYHADFRGRFYPFTTGLSPQGSDLQKACIQFAEGKPLRDQGSVDWFLIHGANKYGVDKVPFKDRIQWVRDNHEMIMAIADDPVGNVERWAAKGSADAPFQFLAWCFEYAEWTRYDRAFISRLPISMDGSCNGLQNFSACLRDEVGGQATNLTPSSRPQDIYTRVADVTLNKLKAMEEDEEGFRSKWIAHGIPRGLVKRSVMTLPYGSTRFSCRDFILKDYMLKEEPKEFPKEAYGKAAGFLAKVVWDSIGDVVIKAREAMDWLQKCSGKILKQHQDIRWRTPTGFVVCQRYQALEKNGTIRVNIFGGTFFGMSKKSDKPDPVRHRNGIAPNFVHSLDAAHMQRVAIRCKREGIHNLAMIHDDFGTLAADAERFNRIIREEFVSIYQEDNWLERFAQDYIDMGIPLDPPPSVGNLDILQVLDSKYFFC